MVQETVTPPRLEHYLDLLNQETGLSIFHPGLISDLVGGSGRNWSKYGNWLQWEKDLKEIEASSGFTSLVLLTKIQQRMFHLTVKTLDFDRYQQAHTIRPLGSESKFWEPFLIGDNSLLFYQNYAPRIKLCFLSLTGSFQIRIRPISPILFIYSPRSTAARSLTRQGRSG